MEKKLPGCHPGRILSQEIPWQVVANIYSEVANYLCKEAQPYPEREGSQNSKESTKNKSSQKMLWTMKLQTLLPIPSDAQYQQNASNAAGFSLTC